MQAGRQASKQARQAVSQHLPKPFRLDRTPPHRSCQEDGWRARTCRACCRRRPCGTFRRQTSCARRDCSMGCREACTPSREDGDTRRTVFPPRRTPQTCPCQRCRCHMASRTSSGRSLDPQCTASLVLPCTMSHSHPRRQCCRRHSARPSRARRSRTCLSRLRRSQSLSGPR